MLATTSAILHVLVTHMLLDKCREEPSPNHHCQADNGNAGREMIQLTRRLILPRSGAVITVTRSHEALRQYAYIECQPSTTKQFEYAKQNRQNSVYETGCAIISLPIAFTQTLKICISSQATTTASLYLQTQHGEQELNSLFTLPTKDPATSEHRRSWRLDNSLKYPPQPPSGAQPPNKIIGPPLSDLLICASM